MGSKPQQTIDFGRSIRQVLAIVQPQDPAVGLAVPHRCRASTVSENVSPETAFRCERSAGTPLATLRRLRCNRVIN
jgi:hypothetical protein